MRVRSTRYVRPPKRRRRVIDPEEYGFVAKPRKEQRWAYLLLRCLTGIDFMLHGCMHAFSAGGLDLFSQSLLAEFGQTHLPPSLILAAGYVIPCGEIIVGLLLVLGILVSTALGFGYFLLLATMFGLALNQEWSAAGDQLIYGVVLSLLLLWRRRFDISWSEVFLTKET